MIRFLLKGILRDKNRSLLPIIIVTIGVALTILISTFVKGIIGDAIDISANFSTGHVKVMTRAYADNITQQPNDLALLEIDEIKSDLKTQFPDIEWVERINFGGLIDVADEHGETAEQGSAAGMAVDLFSPESKEAERMNIVQSIVAGKIPQKSGEALVSADFAEKLKIKPGDDFTIFGSTMNGSMTFQNFTMSGTVRFGTSTLDRGSVVIDISDAQKLLDMDNAAGELLGYFKSGKYDDIKALEVTTGFNQKYADDPDEFAPVMKRLMETSNMSSAFKQADSMTGILIFAFVLVMSIVLWNTGLLGGIRRYSEFGVRLALGEGKTHIYKTLIYESILIGGIGSLIGTAIGLAVSFFLQEHGLDFSSMLKNSSMMIPSVYRASITTEAYYIGFIPGLFSMVLGTALSGIGIYRRNTASLFKELEV